MKGSEAIKIIGKLFNEDFTIEKPPLKEIYEKIYNLFIKYFTESDKNVKGVLLVGKIGSGKSLAMKVIQKLFKDTERAFKWIAAKDFKFLVEDYNNSELMDTYGRNYKQDLYIDDIGSYSVDTYKKYGNSINIISEIILDRYELFTDFGIKTHFSTNIPTRLDKQKFPNQITLVDIYGERVVDRMVQMCEIVVFKGESLRK